MLSLSPGATNLPSSPMMTPAMRMPTMSTSFSLPSRAHERPRGRRLPRRGRANLVGGGRRLEEALDHGGGQRHEQESGDHHGDADGPASPGGVQLDPDAHHHRP